MPKYDDSRPFDTNAGEHPVFSPELQSEKMKEIQEAAVKMTGFLHHYMLASGDIPLDNIYTNLWKLIPVIDYLTLAGDTLGRPFVKQAFSMAIRNYINSKD